MERVYGYARISTDKQNIERQIFNILQEEPQAIIFQEAYTGTTINRTEFNKMLKIAKKDREKKYNVTIIFDEVSRMTRTADEGFALYKELFELGINLKFIKEKHINTEVFAKAKENKIPKTGTNLDIILKAIDEYLLAIAEEQIRIAFEQAEKEVQYLRKRTSEGVRRAQANGKQIGHRQGDKHILKKEKYVKELIVKHSKSFNGTLKDDEVLKIINGTKVKELKKELSVSRNTYYKYKKELLNNFMLY